MTETDPGRSEPGDADAPATGSRPLPPDPAAFDHPRAALARAKGLDAPYIPGGRDPDPESARREERRLLRLLLVMVVVVVLAGFVLGAVSMIVAGVR